MSSLADDLGKSLSKNIVPVSVEFLENGIDELISNNTLRNIPILNSICGVIRVGKDLRERNLLKQTSAFLLEFNSGTIDEEKLQKYKEKLENDKGRISELERVLLILNNNIDVEKSKYLAKLFTAYVNEDLSWREFCEYTDITNRLFMEDFRLLKVLCGKSAYEEKHSDSFRVERIYSMGILGFKGNYKTNDKIPQWLDARCLNILGEKYCSIIFMKGVKSEL